MEQQKVTLRWGAKGKCFDCGCDVSGNYKFCSNCKKKHLKAYEKENYNFLKSMNICTKCKHRPISTKSKCMCDVCLENMRKRARKRTEIKKKELIKNATMQ